MRPPPAGMDFMFATGIENGYPVMALPDGSRKRIDEMEKCGHYDIANEHVVRPDGGIEAAGEIFGYDVVTHHSYARYNMPVMHTETNLPMRTARRIGCTSNGPTCIASKQDGEPFLAFTWYSLTDPVDCDSALRDDAGNVNPLGLADLDRRLRPVGRAYLDMMNRRRDILPSESYSLELRLS